MAFWLPADGIFVDMMPLPLMMKGMCNFSRVHTRNCDSLLLHVNVYFTEYLLLFLLLRIQLNPIQRRDVYTTPKTGICSRQKRIPTLTELFLLTFSPHSFNESNGANVDGNTTAWHGQWCQSSRCRHPNCY